MKTKARARDLKIPFEGVPGPFNALTDVAGIEVGYVTLISGDGPLNTGEGPVRTGVTAILPRGKHSRDPVFASWFSLNGNGEMTGTTWIEESGFMEGPILITNTHSLGLVRDAMIEWQIKNKVLFQEWSLPVVTETYDGYLNDINGFHVKKEHVFQAVDHSRSGPLEEGNVGGGTGMICYEFKGGTGTASRIVDSKDGGYTVGVLVQANHGLRSQLKVAGVPVGAEIPENAPFTEEKNRNCDQGSIIIVVATDAPLLPHQLKRLVKRASLGLALTGGSAANDSGDIFIAFSTANPGAADLNKLTNNAEFVSSEKITPLFNATIQATEEAIINALIGAETMTGADGHTVHAIPHDGLQKVMKKYNRFSE